MKPTLYIFTMCMFGFGLFAQHEHSEIEHLFENKSLADFEQQLNLTHEDYSNQLLLDFVDRSYQNFHDSIHGRLLAGFPVRPLKFELSYGRLVDSLSNQLGQFKPSPSIPGSPKAADGPCVNMDFETGDFTGWTLTRGNVTGATPYSFAGEFAVGPGPYHTVFGGGLDPVTGIPRVNPLGGAFSVRLGNGVGVGARAARLKQTFMVDASNYMFTYSYAVIFESPAGHSLNQLPYFTVRVFDSLGNSIPCGEYSVIADAANAPDYETTTWGGTTVLFKNWETVFTNLSAYIGQNVTVEFTSGDCSLTGHFGYAYVDASCGVDELTASNDIICTGDSSILTAPPGAASYLWSNGSTTQSTTVYTGGVYSCTITPFQGGGCDITLDITITENPSPVANFTSALTACVGEQIDFTNLSTIPLPGIISGYRWDFGDGNVTPISTGAIIGVTNTNGTYINAGHWYDAPGVYNVELYVESSDGCADSMTVPVTIHGLPPVVAGPDQVVCEGAQVTLSGAGAVNYVWDNGITNGVAFTPAVGTITYTVTGTDANGCVNTDQVDVTVNPLPNVDAGADQTVCDGDQVTLIGSGIPGAGAGTYVWDNGVTNGVAFTPPLGITTYTVTGTDGNGCVNTDQVDVTVNALPNVNAGVDQTVCEGTQVTLWGAGAVSYVWDNGVIDGVAFTPIVGTTYTVTGTDGNGCMNTDQVDVIVNPLPNVNASPDQVICEGAQVTLSGAGAVNYVWDNGITDGVAFTPAVGTITYTVTGTDANGCVNTDQVDVTVNPLPNVDAGADQTVCDGNQVTLIGSGIPGAGAGTYVWDNGVTNGVAFTPPLGTTTYTVTGTDGNGCVNTDQVDVTVNALPNVNAGVDQTVCEGTQVTLWGAGAVSYVWDNGVIDGVAFTPIVGTTTYTVTGTDGNGCMNTDQVDVIVNPLPNVNAGPDQVICEGAQVTLSGAGAVNYVWDNGVVDGVAFTPAVGTITYTVTGTDANGCVNTDQVDVTVNPLPNVDAGADQTVCDGDQVTLIGLGIPGAGAGTYVWDNGVTNGVAFTPPLGITTYTVTGTDGNGCVNTDQVDVTVNALPNVNAGVDQTVCEGTQVTLWGAGAVNYVWDNGVIDGVAFTPAVGTTTYTVTGTDGNGCMNTDQVDVTVNPLPNVNAGPDQVICEGEQVTLSGAGAVNYVWDNGITDGVAFTPAVGTITYTVTGTDANGCVNTDQVDVTVNPLPNVDAGVDQQSCDGQWVTLSAVGTQNIYWNNGVINNVAFQQAIGTVEYIVTDSLTTGCTASDTVLVEVLANPIVTGNDAEVCEGEGVVLEGQGAVDYSWSGGVIDGVEFFPTTSATYLLTGTDANGCIGYDDVFVRVYYAPEVDFKILNLSLTSINPTTGFDNLTIGASSYEWDFGDGSPLSYEFEPEHTFPLDESGEYAITLTAFSEEGCPASKVKYIHVFPDYSIFVPNTFTPDGNNFNEVFKPVMRGFDKYDFTMYIFNRWGEIVFESHDMEVGWDGSFANQNYEVQDGVYTWKIVAGLEHSSDTKVFVGHVTILK